jgi:AcrR family transcriptional regulator
MSAVRPRLAASERRAAVLETACRVFSDGSYRGTTTAEIARRAGVTEPVLYRHFASKRDLYLAVLEESWRRLRLLWEAAVEAETDPRLWVGAMGHAYFEAKDPKVRCADLWVQALTEASDDPAIRKFLRKQMREVHDFVTDVIRRSQEAGGIFPDRDASAEAWIFIAIGLLGTVGRRVGGLIHDDFPAIVTQRRRWMTGIEETPDIPNTLDI